MDSEETAVIMLMSREIKKGELVPTTVVTPT